jgi:hypothetical protein
MTFLGALKKIVIGAPLGVLAVTALPVFGAVGTITAIGIAVGSTIGAVAGIADEIGRR